MKPKIKIDLAEVFAETKCFEELSTIIFGADVALKYAGVSTERAKEIKDDIVRNAFPTLEIDYSSIYAGVSHMTQRTANSGAVTDSFAQSITPEPVDITAAESPAADVFQPVDESIEPMAADDYSVDLPSASQYGSDASGSEFRSDDSSADSYGETPGDESYAGTEYGNGSSEYGSADKTEVTGSGYGTMDSPSYLNPHYNAANSLKLDTEFITE